VTNTRTAISMILDGYSHEAAFRSLSEKDPNTAVQDTVVAGQRAPFARFALHAKAEDYTSSQCCDYCGHQVRGSDRSSHVMTWQTMGWTGWGDETMKGLAYVCGDCQKLLGPSPGAATFWGLAWASPLIIAAAAVDYSTGAEGVLLSMTMFVSLFLFLVGFSRASVHTRYRGYPTERNFYLNDAGYRSSFYSILRNGLGLAVVGLFSVHCLATLETESTIVSYAPTIVAVPVLVLAILFLLVNKRNPSRESGKPTTWCSRLERADADPTDPEFLTRLCNRLLTDGASRPEAGKKMAELGAARDQVRQVLNRVGEEIGFARARRGEHAVSTCCDLCGTDFPEKGSRSITWTNTRETYVPLYVATYQKTEKREFEGYHLLCDSCDWRINGKGANFWYMAGSIGVMWGFILSLAAGQDLTRGQFLFALVTACLMFAVLGSIWGRRYRFQGFPVTHNYLPPNMKEFFHGIFICLTVFVVGLLIVIPAFYIFQVSHLAKSVLLFLIGAGITGGFIKLSNFPSTNSKVQG
jgi:hypothetical protein